MKHVPLLSRIRERFRSRKPAEPSELDRLRELLVEVTDFGWLAAHTSEITVGSTSQILDNYISTGAYRELGPNPLFDPSYYEADNPELDASRMSAIEHYLLIGWREGRDPGPYFDTAFYLRNRKDVREANVNPLSHFLQYGSGELQRTAAKLDSLELIEALEESPSGARSDLVLDLRDALGLKTPRNTSRRFLIPEFLAIRSANALHPKIHPVFGNVRRVQVLCRDTSLEGLLSGEGRTLILGVRIANCLGLPVRVSTMEDFAHVKGVSLFLEQFSSAPETELTFVRLEGGAASLDVSSSDVFITSDPVLLDAVLGTAQPNQVVFLRGASNSDLIERSARRLRLQEQMGTSGIVVVDQSPTSGEHAHGSSFTLPPPYFQPLTAQRLHVPPEPHLVAVVEESPDHESLVRSACIFEELYARKVLASDRMTLAGQDLPNLMYLDGVPIQSTAFGNLNELMDVLNTASIVLRASHRGSSDCLTDLAVQVAGEAVVNSWESDFSSQTLGITYFESDAQAVQVISQLIAQRGRRDDVGGVKDLTAWSDKCIQETKALCELLEACEC